MPGWQQGTPGVQAMQGDVYRPTLDFLTASSHTSTPVETQFIGDETFSLEELLNEVDRYDHSPIQTGGVGRGRGAPKKKGKGPVGESSQPANDESSVNKRSSRNREPLPSHALPESRDSPIGDTLTFSTTSD